MKNGIYMGTLTLMAMCIATWSFAAEENAKKSVLPPLRFASGDMVAIEVMKMVPKQPYFLEPLDVLHVDVDATPEERPIKDFFIISMEGMIDLGEFYGQVNVEMKTLKDATAAIESHLATSLKNPRAKVRLAQISGLQPISGQYTLNADGCVNLRVYGHVKLADLTNMEAKDALEKHLSAYLKDPAVAICQFTNPATPHYYIVTQNFPNGDAIRKMKLTDSATVKDAIAAVGGLPEGTGQVYIARPGNSSDNIPEQKIPVDWKAITGGISDVTNYMLMLNDRLVFDTKVQPEPGFGPHPLTPFQRVMLLKELDVRKEATKGVTP